MCNEVERLKLALSIAVEELNKHTHCGDDFPEEGWPNVHQAMIDINLAKEGKHPFQKDKTNGR